MGITVAMESLARDADSVVPNIEDAGGPPLPHQSDVMWASPRKKEDITKKITVPCHVLVFL